MNLEQTKPTKLFVYGTLKRGFNNHKAHLWDAVYLKEAYVKGLMFNLGGFPGLVLRPSAPPVWGELFELNKDFDAMLAACDRLESHPRFYKRTIIEIDKEYVWTYEWMGLHSARDRDLKIIPFGKWDITSSNFSFPFKGEVNILPAMTQYSEYVYQIGVGLINLSTGELRDFSQPKPHVRFDLAKGAWVPADQAKTTQIAVPSSHYMSRVPVVDLTKLPALPPPVKYVDDADPGEETITVPEVKQA